MLPQVTSRPSEPLASTPPVLLAARWVVAPLPWAAPAKVIRHTHAVQAVLRPKRVKRFM
ncbi:hypothetical protein [Lysobacter gummosus]|uniref:hypothetical protein n=1 Tax=Lysobacter gummosus TaxID=262324 RepID=UPI003629CBB2